MINNSKNLMKLHCKQLSNVKIKDFVFVVLLLKLIIIILNYIFSQQGHIIADNAANVS